MIALLSDAGLTHCSYITEGWALLKSGSKRLHAAQIPLVGVIIVHHQLDRAGGHQ